MTYNPPPYGGPPPGQQPPPPPGQYPVGPGGQGFPPPEQSKGFFGALFDFGFHSFVTPSIIKVVYILGLIGIGLTYLFFLIASFSENAGIGIAVLLLGWIPALLYLALWRVVLEFYYAVIRMSEDIHRQWGNAG